ncbi:MAG: HAMP domain-containing protein [Anaerolineae bacterium]|nr:HAMP domain-containing protein [Anaerolineae bacterium]
MWHYRSTQVRIAVSYVLLFVLTMAALTVYLTTYLRRTYLENLQEQLTADVHLVADVLNARLAAAKAGDNLDPLADYYAELLGARLTLIAPDGEVIGESDFDRTQMDNHLQRPEVQQALSEGRGFSMRYSKTGREEFMYVALRVETEESVVGIIRLAIPVNEAASDLNRLTAAIFTATLVVTVLAVVLAFYIANRTTGPVRHLTQAVQQMASGDLSTRTLPTTEDEVGQLARAFNHMATELEEQIRALSTERCRLAAILEHMADGVIIIDEDGQIQMMNQAAAEILETAPETAMGKNFSTVARHHRLIELWLNCRRTQREGREAIETLQTAKRKSRFLQVIITPQYGAIAPGFIVILQDLTRIRRLETVRRDFISNISHELRTPLASLAALVETLQDGAIDDPPAAERFLNHIAREVAAMTQIVEELLELSRIESGRVPLYVKPTPVSDLVVRSVERLSPQAMRSGLSLAVDLPEALPLVLADKERVQRVVTNLVHNAIKFTSAGGSIAVTAYAETNRVVIMVKDTGVGISEEDLPRIFERFYKADRARSGGGTGLGLAISKHIVQAHGGRIWVESEVGSGSTFFFSLPAASKAA